MKIDNDYASPIERQSVITSGTNNYEPKVETVTSCKCEFKLFGLILPFSFPYWHRLLKLWNVGPNYHATVLSSLQWNSRKHSWNFFGIYKLVSHVFKFLLSYSNFSIYDKPSLYDPSIPTINIPSTYPTVAPTYECVKCSQSCGAGMKAVNGG